MSKDGYIDYTDSLSDTVTQMMLDVVLLLNHYGIVEVPASNVMRLLGTPEEEASQWENAILSVDENSQLIITNRETSDDMDEYNYEIPPYLH